MAYGSSQARDGIGAIAAALRHSSRQCCILNPLSEARDRTCVLVDAGQMRVCCATMGAPSVCVSLISPCVPSGTSYGVALFFLVLVTPTAYRSSRARDRTHAAAVTMMAL